MSIFIYFHNNVKCLQVRVSIWRLLILFTRIIQFTSKVAQAPNLNPAAYFTPPLAIRWILLTSVGWEVRSQRPPPPSCPLLARRWDHVARPAPMTGISGSAPRVVWPCPAYWPALSAASEAARSANTATRPDVSPKMDATRVKCQTSERSWTERHKPGDMVRARGMGPECKFISHCWTDKWAITRKKNVSDRVETSIIIITICIMDGSVICLRAYDYIFWRWCIRL